MRLISKYTVHKKDEKNMWDAQNRKIKHNKKESD